MGIATPSRPQIAEENQDIELGYGSRVGRPAGPAAKKTRPPKRRPQRISDRRTACARRPSINRARTSIDARRDRTPNAVPTGTARLGRSKQRAHRV